MAGEADLNMKSLRFVRSFIGFGCVLMRVHAMLMRNIALFFRLLMVPSLVVESSKVVMFRCLGMLLGSVDVVLC
jgi:hypothetical protein